MMNTVNSPANPGTQMEEAASLYKSRLVSKALREAEYQSTERTLLVEFQDGRKYLYPGVDRELYLGLIRAPSPGGFFNREIRHRPYRHIGRD